MAKFNVVQADVHIVEHFIFIGGVFGGAALWWFMLSSVINIFRKRINMRRLWWINKIAGATIVVLVIIAFTAYMIEKIWLG